MVHAIAQQQLKTDKMLQSCAARTTLKKCEEKEEKKHTRAPAIFVSLRHACFNFHLF